jgi:leucyl aminopeptidase (aminopeptidase T)
MKNKQFMQSVLLLVAVFVLSAGAVKAQTDEATQKLAARLVQSASLKPGDVVIVDGGKHMIPLMEAVTVEVQKAGGMPVMFLESDRVARSFYTEVPEKYLEQEPRFWGEWLKNTNVFIGLPGWEDPKAVIDGVPEARFAKISKAGDFFGNLLSSLPVRQVSIDFPTKQDAVNNGMDFPTYQKIMMDGINADYQSISVQGSKLRDMVKNAKQIKITNPAGTDFTFSPAPSREVFVDDGIVTEERAKSKLFAQRIASLPGGNVFFAPLETSANGRVVVPRMECRYAPMNNVNFEFKDGLMQNFKAGTNGECFQERMKVNSGPKDMFGAIWLGINPSLRLVEDGGAHFRPYNAAGMVYVGIGENRLYGGGNNSNAGYSFPITNATVTIDGKTIIKDGKLIF